MNSTRPATQLSEKKQDNKNKHFSLTAFQEPAFTMLQNDPLPDWIDMKAGGLEKCPTTGKIHYQGMIRTKYPVRMSKVINYYKGSHVEVARNPGALINYVLKSETAITEKSIQENPDLRDNVFSYDILNCLRRMSEIYVENIIPLALELLNKKEHFIYLQLMENYGYSYIANQLIIDNDKYAYIYSNPRMKTYWSEHAPAHIARV